MTPHSYRPRMLVSYCLLLLLGTTQFFCGTSSLIVEGTSFTEENESPSLTIDSNSNSNSKNDQHQLRRNIKGESIKSTSAGQGIVKNWMEEVFYRFLDPITKEDSARNDVAMTTLQPPLYEANKEQSVSSLSSEKRDEEQEASESTVVKKESSETRPEFEYEYDVYLDEEENGLNESDFKEEGGEEEKDLDDSTRANLRNLKYGKKGKNYGYRGKGRRYNYNYKYNNYYRPPPRRRQPPRYYGNGYNTYNNQNVVYVTSNIRQPKPAPVFTLPANPIGIVLGDRTFIIREPPAPTTPRPSRPPTPTNRPTSRPSRRPSRRPTSRPSRSPTPRPTRRPSREPTRR
jgi:hypothetical protein